MNAHFCHVILWVGLGLCVVQLAQIVYLLPLILKKLREDTP